MSISLLVAHYYFGRFSIGVHLDQGFKKCFVEVYCLLVVFGVFLCYFVKYFVFNNRMSIPRKEIFLGDTECSYLGRQRPSES